MKRFFATCALAFLASCGGGGGGDGSPSPGTPQSRTVTTSITSTHTGQQSGLQIFLPVGYNQTATRSPTIYILDGNDRLERLLEPLRLQKYENVVLVAVSNISSARRWIDFTMPGAEPYYRFLTQELIPRIDAEYHTDPDFRVLTGHSLSGDFTNYAFFMEPQGARRTFRSFISQDCSCWYHADMVFDGLWQVPIDMLDGLYARNPVLPVKLAMNGSTNGGNLQNVTPVYQRISTRGFQGLDVKLGLYTQGHVPMDSPSFADSLLFTLGPPQP
jgi:hypothetical protein